MELTYHGYAAVELRAADGTTLLVDPYITDNPHCEHSIKEFDDVDAILVTHGADDHLGDAPEIAVENDATIHCDFATFVHLLNTDFPNENVLGYIWGMEIGRDAWSAKVVEARHISMFPREGLLGPALAFVVSIEDQRVYHMGDTAIFGDIELYGELYEPTVSLVPVGELEGFLAELPPDEAALAAEWLDSGTVVPIHYPPGSENPREFRDRCEERGVTDTSDVRLLEPGTTLAF